MYLSYGKTDEEAKQWLKDNDYIIVDQNLNEGTEGGVFAALKGSPLMLAKDTLFSEQISFIKSRKPQKKYVFGGVDAVPNDMVAKVAAAGA